MCTKNTHSMNITPNNKKHGTSPPSTPFSLSCTFSVRTHTWVDWNNWFHHIMWFMDQGCVSCPSCYIVPYRVSWTPSGALILSACRSIRSRLSFLVLALWLLNTVMCEWIESRSLLSFQKSFGWKGNERGGRMASDFRDLGVCLCVLGVEWCERLTTVTFSRM